MSILTPWTPAEDALLTKRRSEGFSFGAMEPEFKGRTRRALIGRAHRLNLPIEVKVKKVVKSNGYGGQRTPRNVPAKAVEFFSKRTEPENIDMPATGAGWPKPRTVSAVILFGLTTTTCRMPLWADGAAFEDQFYCGAPTVPGKSWCAGCLSRISGVGTTGERTATSLRDAEYRMARPRMAT